MPTIFKVILKGLYFAVLTDFSVAYKLALSLPIVMFAVVFILSVGRSDTDFIGYWRDVTGRVIK